MATQGKQSAATATTTHTVCHQAYPSYNRSAKMPSVPQWWMINDDRATMMTLATGQAGCMSRTIFVASMDGHYLSLGCEENGQHEVPPAHFAVSDRRNRGEKIARAKKQKNPRGEGERGDQEFRMRLSFPLVAGAVVIGVISGNVIFGPPLQKYWAEKQQQQQQQQQEGAKEGQTGTT
uniref:Uncharacterized protein n=1 Tax=Oryza glaberrima TaxID=4538 RepID=I1PEC2_ORYGL